MDNLVQNRDLACGLVEHVEEEKKEVTRQRHGKEKKLETSTSGIWNAIGLSVENQEIFSSLNSDMKIGVIDSGIIEHATCFAPDQVKKIGFKGRRRVQDATDHTIDGHGTMVAFILAGRCHQTNFALKPGILRGGFPGCKLQIYKAHYLTDIEIEEAVHAAIKDGVKVLNICIGSKVDPKEEPFSDGMSIGTFEAMIHDILPCVSAGNDGPKGASHHFGGWQMVVSACEGDVMYMTELSLVRDQKSIRGQSLSFIALSRECELCLVEDVKARRMGASGMVLVCNIDDDYEKLPDLTKPEFRGAAGLVIIRRAPYSTYGATIPSVVVTESEGQMILKYMRDHKRDARVTIQASISVPNEKYPRLAAFSPTSPSPFSDNMFKPDISFIGREILCNIPDEFGEVMYSFHSGTSVSTPIVCAGAVCLRLLHPEWSASAVRSAMLTTADPIKYECRSQLHGIGCGIMNLCRAADPGPGVIYDLTWKDYCRYVLGLKQCSKELRDLVKKKYGITRPTHELNFNYPSFKATLKGGEYTCTFRRELTYIGDGPAVFRAEESGVDISDSRLTVTVKPKILSFATKGSKLKFKVTVEVKKWSEERDGLVFARLEWRSVTGSKEYVAGSPIIVVRETNS